MKIKYLPILLITIIIALFTSCAKEENSIEVYSFSGEIDNIALNNGVIVITNDLDKFVGGDLSVAGEELSGIKNCSTEFYFLKDGIETTIQNFSDISKGISEGIKIQGDMGSVSSKDLFYQNDLEFVKKSLHLELSGDFVSGETFEYIIPLKVKKVYGLDDIQKSTLK